MEAVATVAWTRAEIEEALAALGESSTVRGKKKALETLTKARSKVGAKDNVKAHVTIRFSEKPAALLAEVLQARPTPAARSALSRLEKAALQAVSGGRRSKGNATTNLSNVKADARDRRVRHVTGRSRPAR
jgi:hypothetical protein